VYATHGHYCDRHTTVPMFERLAAGVMARLAAEPDGGPRRPEEYEATLAPIYAWIHALAQSGGPQLGESSHGPSARAWRTLAGSGRARRVRTRGLIAAFPALIAGLNRARLGPLRADLSGAELRRAGLRAFSEVLTRLDVGASHAVFGHTHRAGPLPGDTPDEWRTPSGVAMVNAGSWLHEPQYLGESPRRSPYRPGFCVAIDGDEPPSVSNLLDAVNPRRSPA
jgi:hypothetical protein